MKVTKKYQTVENFYVYPFMIANDNSITISTKANTVDEAIDEFKSILGQGTAESDSFDYYLEKSNIHTVEDVINALFDMIEEESEEY